MEILPLDRREIGRVSFRLANSGKTDAGSQSLRAYPKTLSHRGVGCGILGLWIGSQYLTVFVAP